MGALLILFYGETWGRKSSTFWGVGTVEPSSISATDRGPEFHHDSRHSHASCVPRLRNFRLGENHWRHRQRNGNQHDPHLAVRMCSSKLARIPHHTIWMLDLVRYHGILLGGLWVLLSGGLYSLAFPHCRKSSKPCRMNGKQESSD